MNLLILASNRTLTLSLLRCLKEMRARVIVLAESDYPVVRRSGGCHRFHTFDPALFNESPDALLRRIEECVHRYRIDCILPVGIPGSIFLSEVKHRIVGVPVFPIAAANTIRMLNNKWEFFHFLEKAGLPTPATQQITAHEQAEALTIRFPVMVKPLDLDASRGIYKLDSPEELRAHLREQEITPERPLLLQEYIPGTDMSLSLLAEHGELRAWTVHTPLPDGTGVRFVRERKVMEVGRAIVQAVGYHGVANFDMRIDARDGSVRVLECNPRFWATVHIAMCCGVHFPALGLRMAAGKAIPEPEGAEGVYLQPEKAAKMLLAGRLPWQQVTPATRRGLRVELADPGAALARFLEIRLRTAADRQARRGVVTSKESAMSQIARAASHPVVSTENSR